MKNYGFFNPLKRRSVGFASPTNLTNRNGRLILVAYESLLFQEYGQGLRMPLREVYPVCLFKVSELP